MARIIKAQTISNLTSTGSVADSDELLISQSGNTQKTTLKTLSQYFGAGGAGGGSYNTSETFNDIGYFKASEYAYENVLSVGVSTRHTETADETHTWDSDWYTPKTDTEELYCHFVANFGAAGQYLTNIGQDAFVAIQIQMKTNNTGMKKWITVCQKPLYTDSTDVKNQTFQIDAHVIVQAGMNIRGMVYSGTSGSPVWSGNGDYSYLKITAVKETQFANNNYNKYIYITDVETARKTVFRALEYAEEEGGTPVKYPFNLKISALGRATTAGSHLQAKIAYGEPGAEEYTVYKKLGDWVDYPTAKAEISQALIGQYAFSKNDVVSINIESSITSTDPMYILIEYFSALDGGDYIAKTDSERTTEQITAGERSIHDLITDERALNLTTLSAVCLSGMTLNDGLATAKFGVDIAAVEGGIYGQVPKFVDQNDAEHTVKIENQIKMFDYWSDRSTYQQYHSNWWSSWYTTENNYDQSLTSVKLNRNVQIVAEKACFNCRKLTSIDFNSNLTTRDDSTLLGIGAQAFKTTELNAVKLPFNLTTVASEAFANISTLTTVYFPNKTFSSFNGNTFDGSTNITDVYVQLSGNAEAYLDSSNRVDRVTIRKEIEAGCLSAISALTNITNRRITVCYYNNTPVTENGYYLRSTNPLSSIASISFAIDWDEL